MEEGVAPDPVTEADLRAAYDRAPGAYRAPALYQPAHILFAARPDDTPVRTRARERAKAALQTLRDNPRRFAELAREESDCPSRDAGGELGQIGSGETVPEFEAALRAAPLGEIHDQLVETRYGYHVLRLDMRADGAILPFEAVRPRLARACEKANWTRAARGFVQGLIDRAEISGLDLETIPAGPVPA
jgi:peptidyl-prolyl cis-trans isomerase C